MNSLFSKIDIKILKAFLIPVFILFPVASHLFAQEKSTPPNIIILLADDLGWGDLGCYGNPIIQTPNLDQLANEGIRFTQFHSAGTICSPSRAALLTGKSPYRLGIYELQYDDVYMKDEEITIPELLKQKDYETFFAGKWHVSPMWKGMTPDTQGFDYYFASQFNATSAEKSTKNPTNLVRNGQEIEKTEGYYCDLIVSEAMDWLRISRNKSQPFFMEICFSEPHVPVTPPEEYAEKYESPEVDSLARTLGYGGLLRWNGILRGVTHESNFHLKKYYYGMVEQMGASVGRLMDYLKSTDLLENTLVIFTSDNGPEYQGMGYGLGTVRNRCWGSSGPYRGVKRRVYEGGTAVPGIISWPGKIKPSQVCETPVSGVDILSTLCEVAGIKVPHSSELDGTDISALFYNPETIIQRDVPLYWNTPYWGIPNMSMKYDGFTVVASFTIPSDPAAGPGAWAREAKLHHFEVYDVQKDVKQQHDLYPGNEEKYAYLIEKMKSLWRSVQEDCPEWPGVEYRVGPKTLRKTGYDVINF